jgi:hypothetical protein
MMTTRDIRQRNRRLAMILLAVFLGLAGLTVTFLILR